MTNNLCYINTLFLYLFDVNNTFINMIDGCGPPGYHQLIVLMTLAIYVFIMRDCMLGFINKNIDQYFCAKGQKIQLGFLLITYKCISDRDLYY